MAIWYTDIERQTSGLLPDNADTATAMDCGRSSSLHCSSNWCIMGYARTTTLFGHLPQDHASLSDARAAKGRVEVYHYQHLFTNASSLVLRLSNAVLRP